MRRSLGPVLVGLLLAFVAAAAVASMAGLPIAPQIDGEPGRWHFLRTLLPISAYALPGALAAIALSELRRVRGLPFFLFVGMLIAALGFLTLTGFAAPMRAALMTMPSFLKFMTMGLVAGFAYWGIAGKSAGHVARSAVRCRPALTGRQPPALRARTRPAGRQLRSRCRWEHRRNRRTQALLEMRGTWSAAWPSAARASRLVRDTS